MHDDLFFVAVITRALEQSDPRTALREAFDRIETMGQQPRYQRGYRQFLQLMGSAGQAQRHDTPEELATEILDAVDRPQSIEILLHRGKQPVATCTFSESTGAQTVGRITPGDYTVTLDTGRLLWQGRLAEEDLLWSRAYPKRPLQVAADTGTADQSPTRTIHLLDGTLEVNVYAGLESGTVEIRLNNRESR